MITLAGVLVHAFGMWAKHRLEAQSTTEGDSFVTALYWVCRLLLAGALLYLVV